MYKGYHKYADRASPYLPSNYSSKIAMTNDFTAIESARRHYQELDSSKDDDTDSKILEIRKKYEDFPLQTHNANKPKQTTPSNSDRSTYQKISHIKRELQSIPNWQHYARSIIFDEEPSPRGLQRERRSKPSTDTISTEYSMGRNEQSRRHLLKNQNLNFEIKHASSINQSEEKKFSKKPERKAYVNQFQLSHCQERQAKQERQPKRSYLHRQESKDEKSERVDRKITELESRIKEFEKKKRNLEIDFVPFQRKSLSKIPATSKFYDESRSRTPDPVYFPSQQKQLPQPEKQNLSRPPPYKKPVAKTSIPPITQFSSYCTLSSEQNVSPTFAGLKCANQQKKQFLREAKEYYLQDSRPSSLLSQDLYRNERVCSKSFAHKPESQSQTMERKFSQNTFRKGDHSDSDNYYQNCERERKAEEGIEFRKRRVRSYEQKVNNYAVDNLVKALAEQAKLDENFRNNKIWFKIDKRENKWERLRSLLEYEGLQISMERLHEEFQVAEQQDNPFFSVGSQNSSLESVAESFLSSQKHWKRCILRRVSREALYEDGFSSQMIDMDKKGHLVLEDFVRFLNMKTGTFFRNRDIYSIFKRLSRGAERITFEQLLTSLC